MGSFLAADVDGYGDDVITVVEGDGGWGQCFRL